MSAATTNGRGISLSAIHYLLSAIGRLIMHSIQEGYVPTSGGGILYDASRLRKPHDDWFATEYWRARGALEEQAGGRGSVAVLRVPEGRWVLRHYRRGGWIAKLVRDRYLWLGQARTRSFAEWRLLAELRKRGLPVPAPIAARYLRAGITYRADLITEQLPQCRTLADSIIGASLPQEYWGAVGRTLAAFHAQGVQHADLNAHNILLSTPAQASGSPQIYVLDFDRGRLRARGPWESSVLARLQRSLEKIKRQRSDVRFGAAQWVWLLAGYESKAPGTQQTTDRIRPG